MPKGTHSALFSLFRYELRERYIVHSNPANRCALREPFLRCLDFHNSNPSSFVNVFYQWRAMSLKLPLCFVTCCFARFESSHWFIRRERIVLIEGSTVLSNLHRYAFEVDGLRPEIHHFNREFPCRGRFS